jgi:hypothetical protein
MKFGYLTYFLFLLLFVQTVWAADVSFGPGPATVSQDDIFTLEIKGSNFQDEVDGGGISFDFDPGILQVLSVTIDPSVWNFVNSDGTIDNVTGRVSDVLVTAFPGVTSADFIVATIEFQAVGAGSTALTLSESPENPFASGGQLINPAFIDGAVDVQGAPTGDLNNDGAVNAADVLIGNRILLGALSPTQPQQQAGDVAPLVGGTPQPDGMFNLGDVLVIHQKALGLVSF